MHNVLLQSRAVCHNRVSRPCDDGKACMLSHCCCYVCRIQREIWLQQSRYWSRFFKKIDWTQARGVCVRFLAQG